MIARAVEAFLEALAGWVPGEVLDEVQEDQLEGQLHTGVTSNPHHL